MKADSIRLAWRSLRGRIRQTLRRLAWPVRRRAIERRLEVLRSAGDCAPGPADCVVAVLVRDAEHLVEPFLEYYLRLGVAHIVLLDNGSQDDTVRRALGVERVTVLRCTLPYKHYQMPFKRFLVESYGEGRWCLLVDIDEWFDYPGSGELPLRGLLRYLDRHRYTSVVAAVLDMFADGPPESWPQGGREMIDACVWYDPTSLHRWPDSWLRRVNKFADPEMPMYRGGIRVPVFGRNPMLTRFPLLYYTRGGRLRLGMNLHALEGADFADVSVVLRHYKFDRNFVQRWRDTAERGQDPVHVRNYQAALGTLEKNPRLVLRGPAARRLVHVNQLVDEGILRASAAYWDYVRSHRTVQDTTAH